MASDPKQLERFGARFRAAMAYRRVTPKKLAKATSGRVSGWSIYRYMNGEVDPAFTTAAYLAAVLGVNLEYLAYGTEPMVSADWPGLESHDLRG